MGGGGEVLESIHEGEYGGAPKKGKDLVNTCPVACRLTNVIMLLD